MFRLKSPLYAQIELTSSCNLECSHCYNEERFVGEIINKPKKEDIPTERFLEIAQELARNDVFAVTLTGGEPLTTKDRLYETAQVLAQENLEVTLNSNLTLLNEDDVKKLIDSGITGVMTSLFSYDPETHDKIAGIKGAHKRTLKGLDLLIGNIPFTTVNMVVSQNNKDHVYETGNFLSSLGITSLSSSQAVPSNSGGLKHLEHALIRDDAIAYLEDLHKVRQETGMPVKLTNPLPYCLVWEDKPHLRYLLETSTCTGGRTIIQISPEGEVKPCPMVDVSYGNILEEGLEEVWGKMGDWSDNNYVPNECEPCDLTEICRGSCRAEAQRMNGSLDAQNPFSVKPVKMDETNKSSLEVGMKFGTARNIKARKEGDLYVLFADYQYMVTSERTAKFISAIGSNGGIMVDNCLVDNSVTCGIIENAYESGILRRII